MIFYPLFLLLSNFIGAISQVLLKKSALEGHSNFLREYLNLKVIIAYLLFFSAVFIDLYALKFVPVSFVPIIEASSYVFVLVLSRFFFKEKIDTKKALAIFLIIFGLIIYIV